MQMQINELRINSIVKCKISNDNAVYRVVAIDGINGKVMLSGARTGEWIKVEDLKPIKFSEYILFSCNFEVVHNCKDTIRYDLSIDNRFDFLLNRQNAALSGIRFEGGTHYDEARYLHQFQNLYFSITNKELEVSLC